MITVKTFNNAGEAGVAQAQLRAAGVTAILAEEYSFSVGYPVGGLRLQVPPGDVDAARQVLDQQEGFAPLADDFVPPELPPVEEAGTRQELGKNSGVFAFVRGGIWALVALGVLILLTVVLGGRFHVNLGGLIVWFILGGCAGLLVRAIYQKGRRDAAR